MSFKGAIEAKCPGGCLPFEAEIWTFIKGDQESTLREALIAGELNLLLCPECEKPFFPEEAFVYYEPRYELLAFVFPASYLAEEARWRQKMHEDFETFRKGMGEEMSRDLEPEIYFSSQELRALLEKEDYRYEEFSVMEFIALEKGLSLYRVSPRHARQSGIPALLPLAPGKPGAGASVQGVIKGMKIILAANDRLTAYARYLESLTSGAVKELPPPLAPRGSSGLL